MKISGNDLGLNKLGLNNLNNVYRNLPVKDMVNDIINNGEGVVGLRGAAMVDTGIYTGRSPNDKYIVDEPNSTEKIWWGPVNRKVPEEVFDILYNKVVNYYNRSDDSKTYIFDGFAGADPTYSLNVRIIAKKAWQAHFVHNMFIRPEDGELDDFNPEFTIINASDVSNKDFKTLGMNSETFILFHLERRIAIIGGTEYGGEMKKGIFSVLHYLLPQRGVLSMHCSANVYMDGSNPSIFFGLSGTGKTTLSTDPVRPLIGDDEHGWSDDGIFNFEGGCYAKVINLNKDEEPDIYNAIREGALLENVVDNSVYGQGKPSVAGHPEKIIFLTCDAYGVLPPVTKLSSDQAMYHFISGYTAKVAGTERGITEPTATFSPCFGGPFLTLHPLRYAELLKEKMEKFDVDVYLVNTGWVGASAKSGAKRFNLPKTREIINSILGGQIEKSDYETDPYFGFQIPISLGEIDSNLLNPIRAWDNLDEYHTTAKELVEKFQTNYKQYDLGDTAVLNAGPSL